MSDTATQIRYSEAIAEAIRLEMGRDPRVVYIGSTDDDPLADAIAHANGADRVLELGRSRHTAVALGVGAALEGWRPVCRIAAAELPGYALDQLVKGSELHREEGVEVPLTVLVARPAPDPAASFDPEAPERWLYPATGVRLASPASAADAKGLVASAMRDAGPVCVIEDERLTWKRGSVPEGSHLVGLGQASILREGSTLTILAHGAAVAPSLALAAEIDGGVEVLDLRSLAPLDLELVVASVKRTGRALVAEPTLAPTPIGDALIAAIVHEAFEYLDASPLQVAVGRTGDALLRAACDEVLGY
jgi:pyruvate/2-oxoglutarate/acetoin dehydrogenase E1 component